jgi:apolipoprotein N-acyltransferase
VAWVDLPGALPLSAWIGAYGVSALVVATNVGIAASLRRRRYEPAAIAAGVVLVLLAWGGRWGAGAPSAAASGLPVRVIQPNTQNLVEWDAEAAEAAYQRLLRLSYQACDAPGALLIWPESAAWPRVYGADAQLTADLQALVAAGCPVLFNSVRTEGETYFNSAFLFDGREPAAFADKRHLVPFGEYVPGRTLFPFIGKLARNAGDFQAANELRLIPWQSELLGLSICFEIIFPAEVAAAVDAGATTLVTITNDAWYGDTAAPWQHFRAARFRAAENRRPLLRAAITGVSGLIRADGRVVAQLGPGEEGILRGVVGGRRDRSPYSRAPLLPLCAAAALAAFAMLKP